MPSRKIISAKALQLVAPTNGKAVSETLHVDTLIQTLKADFGKITDQRANNARIALDDAIMSAFAVFHLKDQSLLAFDERRRRDGAVLTVLRPHPADPSAQRRPARQSEQPPGPARADDGCGVQRCSVDRRLGFRSSGVG